MMTNSLYQCFYFPGLNMWVQPDNEVWKAQPLLLKIAGLQPVFQRLKARSFPTS